MHSRMITEDGHCFIRMAQCQLATPADLMEQFADVSSYAIDLVKALDSQVLELVASTPFIDQ